MLVPPFACHLRILTLNDLAAVMAIERLSFPTPTGERVYRYDLAENRLAHYQALTHTGTIIGYAGYWLIADEAHISIVAVHPDWRGRGLGELLVLNMLHLQCNDGASLSTLEVRRSNKAAQALYAKYGFEVVGERKRYYKNKEDALIMTRPFPQHDCLADLAPLKMNLFQRLRTEAS